MSRAVWLRDLERCAFVGKNGRRCAARAFLELHHVKPYGASGEPTVANIEADLFYGARRDAEGGGIVAETAATYRSERSTRSRTSTSAGEESPRRPVFPSFHSHPSSSEPQREFLLRRSAQGEAR